MFYEQIKLICKERGITPSFLLSELGMSKGNLPNWKIGKKPSFDVLQKISKYLDVSVDFLLENEFRNIAPYDIKLSELEHAIIKDLKEIDPETQKEIHEYIKFKMKKKD